MKIIREIDINKKQKIVVIEDKENTLMFILDINYGHLQLCFGTEKDKFNFSDEELIEFAKEDFDRYYKDIEILEAYWCENEQ